MSERPTGADPHTVLVHIVENGLAVLIMDSDEVIQRSTPKANTNPSVGIGRK